MTLQEHSIKKIVANVIQSIDHRAEVVNMINAEFLQFAIDFFKEIVEAKLKSEDITMEWYKRAFLNSHRFSPDEIAINAGLNKKTISNMYRSATKEIVIGASNDHFDALYDSISTLVDHDPDIDLTLTIRFRGVSVDLNVNESLIVINTLAVKRAALRGGAWSTVGKRVEKPLMITLCKLYQVDEQNYNAQNFVRNHNLAVDREIDFYLQENGIQHKCEVKLMGQGNPESADAIIARGSEVFVADTLSQQNKNQCDQLKVSWVALKDTNGYRRFRQVLERFQIPFTDYRGTNIADDVNNILNSLF